MNTVTEISTKLSKEAGKVNNSKGASIYILAGQVATGLISYATHWLYLDQSNHGMPPKMVFSMNNVQTATLTGELAIQFDEWENP